MDVLSTLSNTGTGSISLSLAPHFSEVTTSAAKTISRFNGFPRETEAMFSGATYAAALRGQVRALNNQRQLPSLKLWPV
jgi:hypothetical protein